MAIFDAYPYALGGAHVVARQIVRAGAESGRWRATVVLPDDGDVARWLRSHGAPVRVVAMPASLLLFARSWKRSPGRALFALPLAWWRLFRAFADVDVVHAHDVRGLLLAGPAAMLRRARLVVHVHHGNPGGTLWRWFVRGPLRWSRATVVVPSRRAAESWLAPVASSAVELANPVDPVGRAAERPPPTVVTLSRIHPEKGLTYLLDAMEVLRTRGCDARLLVAGGIAAGQDEHADEISARAAAVGNVELLGEVADPRTVLAGAWVYVQPSLAEALPNATLEAAAAGLPTVATTVGGLPDIVVDGVTGILVPPANAVELADAIERLLDDADLRESFGRAGFEHVRAHFGEEQFAAALTTLYRAST